MVRSISFIAHGTVDTRVTVIENPDGTLTFDLEVLGTAAIGDLRAVYFDLDLGAGNGAFDGDAFLASGADVTDQLFSEDEVRTLGGDTGMGPAIRRVGKFDAGVEFGTPGIDLYDIQFTSFTLEYRPAGPGTPSLLTLDMLDTADFGLRFSSVASAHDDDDDDGDDDDARDSIARIIAEANGVARDDIVGVDENDSVFFDLLANDTNGATTTVSAVADADGAFAPAGSGFERLVVIDGREIGTQTVGADGTAAFVANGADVDALAAGEEVGYAFSYTTTAPDGSLATATAMVTITGVNDDPTAGDDGGTVSENGPAIVIALLSNDGDIDGDALTISGFDLSGLRGLVTDNGDGTISYDPNGAFAALRNGENAFDSFSYTISDGNGGTATATVNITVEGVGANVGYYTLQAFQVIFGQPIPIGEAEGSPEQVNEIVAAGHTPIKIFEPTAAELAEIDVLYVNNPSNIAYSPEFLSNLGNIFAAVANGMTLMVHDRFVTEAASILPNASTFNFVRDVPNPGQHADVNLLPGAYGAIDTGPGGTLTDATLDGGNASAHGYAVAGSLPLDADLLLSRANPTEVVTFGYGFGQGYVIYSSIPLDFLTRSDPGFSGTLTQAEAEIYAANIIDYGVDKALDLIV